MPETTNLTPRPGVPDATGWWWAETDGEWRMVRAAEEDGGLWIYDGGQAGPVGVWSEITRCAPVATVDEVGALADRIRGLQSMLEDANGSEATATSREKAEATVAQYRDDASRVMAEECAPDELHCACVVHLRAEVARLRQAWQLARGRIEQARDPALRGDWSEWQHIGEAIRVMQRALDPEAP